MGDGIRAAIMKLMKNKEQD
jgi:hypothetical protein